MVGLVVVREREIPLEIFVGILLASPEQASTTP